MLLNISNSKGGLRKEKRILELLERRDFTSEAKGRAVAPRRRLCFCPLPVPALGPLHLLSRGRLLRAAPSLFTSYVQHAKRWPWLCGIHREGEAISQNLLGEAGFATPAQCALKSRGIAPVEREQAAALGGCVCVCLISSAHLS